MREREHRPEILGPRTIGAALTIHAALFALFFLLGWTKADDEVVIPIDTSVVVNENPDGDEDEPPPLDDPKPQPEPQPEPKPEPKPEPPPPVKDVVTTSVVARVDKPKKPEPPKEPVKKPEKPRKTVEERMAEIRAGARPVKIVVKNQPSGNGRTERQTRSEADIRRLLNEGVPAGSTTRLAANEMSECMSKVKMAIDRKWRELAPAIDGEGFVEIAVTFDSSSRMRNVGLRRSCGHALSDKAATDVVSAVGFVPGLTSKFVSTYGREPLIIRYEVKRR